MSLLLLKPEYYTKEMHSFLDKLAEQECTVEQAWSKFAEMFHLDQYRTKRAVSWWIYLKDNLVA